MKQDNKMTVKVPRLKRRCDFLFHNGEFRNQAIPSAKLYNRKKVVKNGKKDIDNNY